MRRAQRMQLTVTACQRLAAWREILSFQATVAPTVQDPALCSLNPSNCYQTYPRLLETELAEALVEVTDDADNRFKIFAVKHPLQRTRARALLERRYAWRGYSVQSLPAVVNAQMTLSAADERSTVATITAGLDCDDGLFVERLYPDDVAALRKEGAKLCEFTKFAVDESVRSQALLGAIFHVACMYVMEVHQCTDALIEVNPRHVKFYEQMLGFRQAAEQRQDLTVDAPAVLLRLDLRHCAQEIDRLGGQRRSARRERSFYPYFFAPEEASRIAARLSLH